MSSSVGFTWVAKLDYHVAYWFAGMSFGKVDQISAFVVALRYSKGETRTILA